VSEKLWSTMCRSSLRNRSDRSVSLLSSFVALTVLHRELGVCVVDGVRDVGGTDAVGAELSLQERDLVRCMACAIPCS
jgi:hypothetical protein